MESPTMSKGLWQVGCSSVGGASDRVRFAGTPTTTHFEEGCRGPSWCEDGSQGRQQPRAPRLGSAVLAEQSRAELDEEERPVMMTTSRMDHRQSHRAEVSQRPMRGRPAL